jgi:hypothetical protein
MEELGDKFEATAVSKKFYRMVDNELLSCPVFCMYTVYGKENDPINEIKIDEKRLKKFGDFAVIITNFKEFISRIASRLPDFNYELVRYIDMKNPTGIDKPAIFNPIVTKDKYFEYQREFRIFSNKWALSANSDFYIPNIKYISNESKKFSIESIKNITQCHPIDELFKGIKVELSIDWDFCHIEKYQTKLPKE